MPFADRDAGLPAVQKFDARVDLVRDHVNGGFKAIIVTDLDEGPAKTVADEVVKWCTDPRSVVTVVSTNVLINWVEI